VLENCRGEREAEREEGANGEAEKAAADVEREHKVKFEEEKQVGNELIPN